MITEENRCIFCINYFSNPYHVLINKVVREETEVCLGLSSHGNLQIEIYVARNRCRKTFPGTVNTKANQGKTDLSEDLESQPEQSGGMCGQG